MFDWLFSLVLSLPPFRGKSRLLMTFRGRLRWTYIRPIFQGLLMRIHPTEWAQFELLCGHILERKTLALYERILAPGDIYVDVGAHLGFHSLIARHQVGSSGRVLAIEPQPYNCDSILENSRLNGFENVAVQIAAVGGQAGFASLALQPQGDRSVLSLLDALPEGAKPASVSFRVPLMPLKGLLEQNGISTVKLLKIDVEGYELTVLDGMKEASEMVENIILEILPPPLARVETLPIFEQLTRMGFTLWRTVEGLPVKPNERMPDNNLWATRPAGHHGEQESS